jgi:2-polyprenyl-6-methoxyphenol hydroxylase-like FAD-dependent oxidoreductase
MEADLAIGADGPSSTVRSLLMPGVERTYAGYIALRGTVLKEEASPEAQKVFSERFVFHHQTGIQILVISSLAQTVPSSPENASSTLCTTPTSPRLH